MKTIALLGICAALALADQDGKKTPDQSSPSTTPAPAKGARPATFAPSQPIPIRHNLHQPTTTPTQGKLTPEQKAASALPTVPQGAQEAGPNLYRFTDPQGKVWMYRKTPFGVSKWEEKPGEQQPRVGTPASGGLTATDLGDSVQFQRATPFGPQKWTRKKSEMTDDEKAAFAAQESAKHSGLGTKPADAAKPPEQQ
jgi:hypothetical protein